MAVCPPLLMTETITMGDSVARLLHSPPRARGRRRWRRLTAHSRSCSCSHCGASLSQIYFCHLERRLQPCHNTITTNADGANLQRQQPASLPPPALRRCTGSDNWQSSGKKTSLRQPRRRRRRRFRQSRCLKPGPPISCNVQPLACEHRHACCFWPIRQA